MKYIFLTKQFYIDHANYKEIEMKRERPYVQVYVHFNGIDFAIPMRSNITHRYAFWTDKSNNSSSIHTSKRTQGSFWKRTSYYTRADRVF